MILYTLAQFKYNELMKKYFYTHLIEIDTLYTQLDSLTLSSTEKKELILIIETTVHHVVLDIALTHLPHHAKKDFVNHVNSSNHKKAMLLLRSHVADIENIIKKEVAVLVKKFQKDIRKLL